MAMIVSFAGWAVTGPLTTAADTQGVRQPITEFTVPDFAGIGDIVVGSDKNLWFTEADQAGIGRITTSGTVTSYPVVAAVNPPIPDVVNAPPGAYGPGYHGRFGPVAGQPQDLTVGSDGNLWYSVGDGGGGTQGVGALGRMTTDGAATAWFGEAPELARCGARSVVGSADGAIWYTVPGAGVIGRLDPGAPVAAEAGVVVAGATEYTVATDGALASAGPVPVGETPTLTWAGCNVEPGATRLRRGPDGQLWFGGYAEIVSGPSSAGGLGNIGWISSSGTVASYLVSAPETMRSGYPVIVTDIAAGSDGTVWFTAMWPNVTASTSYGIGHLFTTGHYAGAVEWMSVTATQGQPQYLTRGPDGNIWFTDPQTNSIGRITSCGVVDRYRIPTDLTSPSEIVSGPDGNIWFTEPGNWFTHVGGAGSSRARGGTWPSDFWNAIGRLSLSAVSPPGACSHAVRPLLQAAGTDGYHGSLAIGAAVARRRWW